jgi:two-component system sensor histidine kinase/response regulator
VPEISGPRSVRTDPSDRVLVAEDNAINQRVVIAMLEHLGFDVDVVSDGTDAVRAAILTQYRAILMDCQLPGLDGYQATGEIRRLEGAWRHVPIIAVTASATESDRQRCLAAGMDDYLAKPLSLHTLATLLARWAPVGSLAAVADVAALAAEVATAGPAPIADPAPAVLDAHVVGRLERLGVMSGQDLVAQLATLFLADADVRLGALRQALSDSNTAAVVRSAHALIGSSANVGATDLARLCATLATDSAASDPVSSRALFSGIEVELERVRTALGLLVPAA